MISARWMDVVLVTLLAVPVAIGLVAALAWWRRGTPSPWLNSATEVGLVLGTAPWLWMILTPSGTGRSIEAVPLRGLFEQVSNGTAVEQVGGNLLVFAALGCCVRLRWRLPLLGIVALAAGASVTVEILQFALDIGRVSSIDDILLNTLGAFLAASAAALFTRAKAAPDRR